MITKKGKKRRTHRGVSREESRRNKEVRNLLQRFAKYLTQRRDHDNLTLRVIAERAHIPHSSIYQIEQCNKDPRMSELARLAQAYNESLRQFLVPFLAEYEEPLEAPAEGGERKEPFTEIPISSPASGARSISTDAVLTDVAPDREENRGTVTEMPMNRSCDKCGYVHAVGMECPGPEAVNNTLFGYQEP